MQLDYELFTWATHLEFERHPRSGRVMQKLTLVAFVGHANARGECWPAITTVAEEIGEDRRDVRNAVEALLAAGHLVDIGTQGRTRKFRLGRSTGMAVHTASRSGRGVGGGSGGDIGGSNGGIHRLQGRERNEKGTPPAPRVVEATCEEHQTERAVSCRSCIADVKAGERAASYVGRRRPPVSATMAVRGDW